MRFDVKILLYISALCGCGLMLGRLCEKSEQETERRKELEQQGKEREQQRAERLQTHKEYFLMQIMSCFSALPTDSNGKSAREISIAMVHENLLPQEIEELCFSLLRRGCLTSRETFNVACHERQRVFFYRSPYITEEELKKEQREQRRKREEREKQEHKQQEQVEQEKKRQKRERQKLNREVVASGMAAVDKMDGHQFEHYCASLLRKLNFTNVEVTKGSGDQGVDIVAVKEGVRYAIQCKCYSSSLGNSPIQEVNAGKQLYGCHVAVVLTNQHFTSGAKTLAAATGVLLWDRDELERMIKKAGGN